MSMIESALRYANMGWGVIPCSGKVPISKHGSSEATNDLATISAVWRQHPSANIAVATGYSWPFWVLDLDVSEGTNGIEAFEDARNGRTMPDTLQQVTGRGGTHYFFKYPTDGRRVKNSASKVAPGVDVRGDGGYVVVAPSIHPTTKMEYIWDGMAEVEQQPVAEAPEWLLALVCERQGDREPVMVPEVLQEGKRNVSLFRVACAWRNTGMSRDTILAGLLSENNRHENRLPTNEIQKIAESACRYEPKQLTPQVMRKEIASMDNSSSDASVPIVSGPNPEWSSEMIANNTGVGKNILYNADLALSASPAFHGAFAFNEFTGEAVVVRDILGIKAGSALGDNEAMVITSWMQKNYPLDIREDTVAKALELVSRRNSSHPVRNYLRGLEWDGEERVDMWLSMFLGVEQSDYSSAVGRRWLISAVARVMEPGCKADCCLMLQGKQGIGKSTALRILAGNGAWYSDSRLDFKSKDAYGNIHGVWIYEIGEYDAISKAETGDVKRFISAQVDKFRPPFARKDSKFPRQCVFAASTNRDEIFHDDTGNRRFWPVVCGKIYFSDLAKHVDQIWAEAVKLYDAGEKWHLDTVKLVEMASEEAANHMMSDPWEQYVSKYIESAVGPFTSTDVLRDSAINMPIERITKSESNRVSAILRRMGYTSNVYKNTGKCIRRWSCE